MLPETELWKSVTLLSLNSSILKISANLEQPIKQYVLNTIITLIALIIYY